MPQILIGFFKKIDFWLVDPLERGVGVRKKCPKEVLRENDLQVFSFSEQSESLYKHI